MENTLLLSSAFEGYLLFAAGRRLSSHTLAKCENAFKQFSKYLAADPPLASIKASQVSGFLSNDKVRKSTALTYHGALRSFWTWAAGEGLVRANILDQVPRPKAEKTAIEPISEKDIKALIETLTYSRDYHRPGKVTSRNKLPAADRNRAMILLLLDTGLRATELCDLTIRDADLKNKRIRIQNGKGDKERYLPISARTGSAIWKYLSSRKDDSINSPLFITIEHNALDRDQLRKILMRAGARANLVDIHPHRFRHTFAINFLRNGGDIYTLQMILGHSSFLMVRHYLALAQVDLDAAHRRASPVENMHL